MLIEHQGFSALVSRYSIKLFRYARWLAGGQTDGEMDGNCPQNPRCGYDPSEGPFGGRPAATMSVLHPRVAHSCQGLVLFLLKVVNSTALRFQLPARPSSESPLQHYLGFVSFHHYL